MVAQIQNQLHSFFVNLSIKTLTMNNLNISIIQTDLVWEDKEKNLEKFDGLLEKVSKDSQLIVLPEMFTTGFTMEPERLAEDYSGMGFQWMKKKAADKNAVIMGSLVFNDNGNYHNRLFFVSPDGSYEFYDKRHLFRMAREHEHYTQGNDAVVVTLNGWRIRLLICYDLRFPVWSRNRNDYDLLIVSANWPEVRREAWRTLLLARAHENQAYVVGVNRIGKDGRGVMHSGDSMVVDPQGKIISKTQPFEESVENLSINLDMLNEYRQKFPAHLDADRFEIKE